MRALIPAVLLATSCATAPLVEHRSAILEKAKAYDVEILRDTWGVPHLFGKRDVDAVYGLAWAHAEDDFRTIEDILTATRGKLARAKGADAAPTDYFINLLEVWRTVDAGWPEIPADVRAIADAYADGINHYAATHPGEVDVPWLYPVRGQDVVAGVVFKAPLFYGLDGALKELFREERVREVALVRPEQPKGSNAMAVSKTRSDDETTRLFINSHQPWAGPVTWYEAHLVSEEGLDVAGGTFPGAPVILHGFNRHVGWAFTVNKPDLYDIFVLEMNPDDEDQYKHDGKWLDLDKRMAKLEVNIFGFVITVEREVLASVHGPVVRRPHGVYAIRYAGMGEHRLLEQLFRMNKATTFDDWREAMRMQALPSFNAVFADKEGHVAYFYNAKLPRRPEGVDSKLYLPGDDPRLVWTDHYRFDEIPQVIDPPSGVVFNSNNHPFLATTGDANLKREDYPPSVESRMTNRALRAHALFSEDEGPISKQRLVAIKHDKQYEPESMFGRARDEIVRLKLDDPELQEAQRMLSRWDLTAGRDDRLAPLGILTGLTYYTAYYDPAYEPDVEASFRDAVKLLKKHFGRLDPTWGEVNRLRRGDLDLPLGGGPDTLRAVAGEIADDGRYVGTVGDSLIILVEWGPDGGVRAESVHQYGSSTLHEEDPHFGDQAELFAVERYKDVWLDRADIEANLERRYRPGE
jgi:penicillin amidase/acyl-homoserine-lactone acylase